MNDREMIQQTVTLQIAPGCGDTEAAQQLKMLFGEQEYGAQSGLILKLDEEGLALCSEGQVLRGDFARMLPRLKAGNLPKELLVRAARIKGADAPLTAVDATAGLGEDSLLLAAAGFRVKLYERNPVVYQLLRDTLRRAGEMPELEEIMSRMQAIHADSIEGMKNLDEAPDVILLDPMFPARQKSALVKKKLQTIQKLEQPCLDEEALLLTAMNAGPKKLIIKRPPKGPWLAGIKPDHSIEGKAVRFDCFVSPKDRMHKLKK